MEREDTRLTQNLLLFATGLVLSHFGVVMWHLIVLARVQLETSRLFLLLLTAINLIPVAALVALGKGWRKLAGWMIVLPLGIAFGIGSYAHFLSAGSDNVFRMPPQPWKLSFQASAVLLATLEALSCWVGLRMLKE